MKTTIALLVLFFAVLGGGYTLYSHNEHAAVQETGSTDASTTDMAGMENGANMPNVTSTTTTTTTTSSSTTSGTAQISGSYTSAQVATHNTTSSCWAIINGNVYNLTSWISQHPGGAARILSICGKDGTSAFEGQHANDGRAQQTLATFKIGTLAS